MSESGFLGLLVTLLSRRKTKKTIRKIQRENYQNKGITRYKPSQIEAFFNDSEPFNHMAFSGGLNSIRAREMVRAAECAYIQGYTVIVMHCSNKELENAFVSHFGNSYTSVINSGNPVYDPFWGMSNQEISRLILSSTSKGYEIGTAGKYYIDGISDFVRARGKQPYCQMYITCPHLKLIDQVNDAEATGKISRNVAQTILTQLMQGASERGNIENFFGNLSYQAGYVIAKKNMLNYAVNARIASQRKQFLIIDVQAGTNSLLINLLLSEAEMLISQGRRVMVIADNIQQSDSNNLQSFLKRSSSNCSVVLSSDDVFSSFGGEENAFFAFAGRCSKVILSKHSSAYSCQKWADYIGNYDKQEISDAYVRSNNLFPSWGFGSTKASSVSIKRENIVKPEEIQRLQVNEVFVVNKSSGEVSLTTIV